MDLALKEKLLDLPELRRRLRQLRWFKRAFKGNADLVAAHLGIRAEIDDRLLNEAFFAWVAAIAPVQHDESFDRADRILFMGGLALRELLRARPATILVEERTAPADDDATAQIAHFWPEGFLYTNFCVCAIVAVHQQEFGTTLELDQAASDLRTWWSYRENVGEDENISIAFLDRFLGKEPNWILPSSVPERRALSRLGITSGRPSD
jgi:hypothetical protein